MSNSTLLETIKDFTTSTEFKKLLGYTGTSNTSSNNVDAVRVEWNGKVYIFPMFVLWETSWFNVNDLGLIKGKKITFKDKKYIVRLMKGSEDETYTGSDKVGTPETEYYQIVKQHSQTIKTLVNSGYIYSERYSFLMKEEDLNNSGFCLYLTHTLNSVGEITSINSTTRSKGSTSSNYHTIFVLEEEAPYIECGIKDLGEIKDAQVIPFQAYNIYETSMEVSVKIDNKLIVTLENVAHGSNHAFTLSNSHLSDLTFGDHELTFSASTIVNGETIHGAPATVKFELAKETTKPITDFTVAKLINQIKLLDEDMEYHLNRLTQGLNNINIPIETNSTLASIVKKVKDSNGTMQRWAKGTVTTQSDRISFNFASGNTFTSSYIILPNLNFKPSTIVAIHRYTNEREYLSILSHSDNSIYSPSIKTLNCATSSETTVNYNYRADSRVYISDNTIHLPVYGSGTYEWIAYE